MYSPINMIFYLPLLPTCYHFTPQCSRFANTKLWITLEIIDFFRNCFNVEENLLHMKRRYGAIVIYPIDYTNSETELGPKTKALCDAALVFLKKKKLCCILLAAGKKPGMERQPILSFTIYNYLRSELNGYLHRVHIHLPNADVWKVLEQTREIVKLAEEHERTDLYIFSGWWSITHVWLSWQKYGKKYHKSFHTMIKMPKRQVASVH